MRNLEKLEAPRILQDNQQDWLDSYVTDQGNSTKRYRYRSPLKKCFIYRSLRHRDRAPGLEAAERLTSRRRAGAEAVSAHYTTIARLLRLYSANRTPQKKATTQGEDVRRCEMMLRVFGSETLVKSISRAMWDLFIHLVRSATSPQS